MSQVMEPAVAWPRAAEQAVRVRVPATLANLGAGFDVFGISIDAGWEDVSMARRADAQVVIEIEGPGAESIPVDPALNVAGRVLRRLAPREGVYVRIRKGVPPAKGLGSSAASAAGAALAADRLFGLRLPREAQAWFAAQAEASAHMDNVAAALLGGFTLAVDGELVSIPPPRNLAFAIRMPAHELRTAESRMALPGLVSLEAFAEAAGRSAAFVHALMRGDLARAGRMAERSIVDAARTRVVPDLEPMRRAARDAGACGVVIAGSGPSVAAIVDADRADPEEVARAMGPGSFVSRPCGGAHVVDA
jgi:homoserine kinase